MLPIRCFSCNKVLANKGTTFHTLQKQEVPFPVIWGKLGLTRMCCRSVMLSYVDVTDELMKYCDYNPSKYIEIRKQPPNESVTITEPDDLNLQDLTMEDEDEDEGNGETKTSSPSPIPSPAFMKGVRVYRAI